MPDPTPDTVHRVPLAEIDDAALARDRGGLDETELTELRLSIAASGLRIPVELFALSEPRPPHRYGLLSGLRPSLLFPPLQPLFPTGHPSRAVSHAPIRIFNSILGIGHTPARD